MRSDLDLAQRFSRLDDLAGSGAQDGLGRGRAEADQALGGVGFTTPTMRKVWVRVLRVMVTVEPKATVPSLEG